MKLLKRFFIFVILLLWAGFIYQHQDEIVGNIRSSVIHFFPCSIPLTYSLGGFDTRFDVTKEAFLDEIERSEKLWESAVGKELFTYVPDGGDITLNLIYDSRQATTEKLEEIDEGISDKQETYDTLYAEYLTLKERLRLQKADYHRKLWELEAIRTAYEKEVARWNKRGGAPQQDRERLEQQRDTINARVNQLNNQLASLNKTTESLNTLAVRINAVIDKLHLDIDKFNTTKATNGEEFSEGEYIRDTSGMRINIYQFSDGIKLSRVLTHEFGHALGLKHVTEAWAIMYRMNEGKSDKLAESDKAELMRACHVR